MSRRLEDAQTGTPSGPAVTTVDAPQRIGNYRVIAKIGEGGMASVYLGVMCGLSNFTKLLVIKVLHREMAERADTLAMFLDEARIAARLNHTNVVDTYEVGQDGGCPFIAMEYLQGQPYSAVLRRIGRETFPLAVQLEVISEVLEGLHYVHELRDFDGAPLGLVHRDVSPQNVFINYDGRVKLVDFGIAKAACSQQDTRAGVIKGKISYLAPEQASDADVDRRADVFAVGVMLWEAIAQRRFTSGTIDAATIHKRVQGTEPRIREVAPDAPAALARICDRALEVDPDDRYGTALEFQRALDAFREGEGHRVDLREVGRMIAQCFASERALIDHLIEGNTAAELMHRSSQPSLYPELKTSESVVPEPDETEVRRPAPPRRLLWAAGLGVSLILARGTTFLLGRATTPPIVASSTSGGLPSSQLIPSSAAAASIRLEVHTTPQSAQLWIDGVRVDDTPIDLRFPRDGRAHSIRLVSEGFRAEERVVGFDRDLRLDVQLTPLAQPLIDRAEPVRDPGPPAREPGFGDDLRTGKGSTTPRSIDSHDPYGE